MNERIKQLEAQCWESRKWNPPWFDYQKFAELLILECIAVHKDDYGVDIIGKVLKKHFGVSDAS